MQTAPHDPERRPAVRRGARPAPEAAGASGAQHQGHAEGRAQALADGPGLDGADAHGACRAESPELGTPCRLVAGHTGDHEAESGYEWPSAGPSGCCEAQEYRSAECDNAAHDDFAVLVRDLVEALDEGDGCLDGCDVPAGHSRRCEQYQAVKLSLPGGAVRPAPLTSTDLTVNGLAWLGVQLGAWKGVAAVLAGQVHRLHGGTGAWGECSNELCEQARVMMDKAGRAGLHHG